MKKITSVVFGILIGFQAFGQNPDPELFKTWNLYKMEIEFGGTLVIADIDPPISPHLTIYQDLSFEGYGACNSFSGNYEYNASEDKLRPINYSATSNNCETQFLNDFEFYYFEFFSIEDDYSYMFYTDVTDNSRHMYYTNNPFGMVLDFVAEPLSITESELINISIYPNPVNNQLFLKLNNSRIEKATIFSISGKKIREYFSTNSGIDVNELDKGMYFLEIITSEGRRVEKFIKK